jgi:LysR family glycine cleavage system transcriptional activator
LRFYADAYATHDLNASAALEGAGVAPLSPTIFAPLLREGRLIQPFPEVILGPSWHYILLRCGEARPAVRGFCAWLTEEARGAARS